MRAEAEGVQPFGPPSIVEEKGDVEEEEIVRRARTDHRWFGPLFEKYYPPVKRYILRRVIDYDVADDIASETFLKALLKLSLLRRHRCRDAPARHHGSLRPGEEKMILFRRYGLFFVPVRWGGWALSLLAVGYTAYAFFDIDSRSHSASDTLINTAFRGLIAAVVYSAIAFIFSKREDGPQQQ